MRRRGARFVIRLFHLLPEHMGAVKTAASLCGLALCALALLSLPKRTMYAGAETGQPLHPVVGRPAPPLQAEQIELYTNDLTGPAFPPGWLVPGSFPQLQLLRLGANAGLTGTLPATLPWPKLELL